MAIYMRGGDGSVRLARVFCLVELGPAFGFHFSLSGLRVFAATYTFNSIFRGLAKFQV